MHSLSEFVRNIEAISAMGRPDDGLSVEQARAVVRTLNEFLFTNYEGIGETVALGEECEFVSDYHKFWLENHRDILNPSIDDEKCALAAESLHEVFLGHPCAFTQLYDTCGLDKEEICLLRFFSAPQDFRDSNNFSKYVELHRKDPGQFDCTRILETSDHFVNKLHSKQSQTDKRLLYAQTQAKFLIDNNIKPIQIQELFDYDLSKIREFLINSEGMGFGQKKTDMFIRDMVLQGVWDQCAHFEEIDVASDRNTIKVALRTGILKTEIPLVSSFLDIFCHQYSLIDDWTAKAWRRVWEIWALRYPDEAIESPCLMDYFIYRVVGKEFCKPSLVQYEGKQCGHTFFWHTAALKKCRVCKKGKSQSGVEIMGRMCPCMSDNGHILIENAVAKDEFVNMGLTGMKECPFKAVCNPGYAEFITLEPPKSISIKGRTGWTTAYARSQEGGGGLMA